MRNNKMYHLKNPSNFRGVFCLVFFLLTYAFFAQPQIKFIDAKKSFGFVKKGELVTLNFEYKNIGNEPLIITDAKVECSCTTIDFTKQPIAPNQKGTIIVKFDTKSVYDRQDRVVEIISNSINNQQKIRFKGVVLK